MTSPEIVRTVRLIVQDNEGRLFMPVRPRQSRRSPGDTDFLGGKVDPSESSLEALTREVEEESGFTPDPSKMHQLYSASDLDGDRCFVREYYSYEDALSVDVIKKMPEHIGMVCVSTATALEITDFIPHQRAISCLEQL